MAGPKVEKVTTSQVAEVIAKTHEITRKEAKALLETISSNVLKALKAGKKIQLGTLGTFGVRQTKGGKRFSALIGRIVDIRPKKKIKFQPGKTLKTLQKKPPA